MNESILRRAVTYLVKYKKMTREEAWVHIRTHGVQLQSPRKPHKILVQTPQNKKDASRREQLRKERIENRLCVDCGKSAGSYTRCLPCRAKDADRSKYTMRRLRARRKKVS